jgi:hypothetical protein
MCAASVIGMVVDGGIGVYVGRRFIPSMIVEQPP